MSSRMPRAPHERRLRAVLIDFGLATTDDKALAGGSPWYIPPEYMEREQQRGAPGDVWALGLVGLFLLKKLPLPETSPGWLIADTHNAHDTKCRGEARERMKTWLTKVEGPRESLKIMTNEHREMAEARMAEARMAMKETVYETLQQNPEMRWGLDRAWAKLHDIFS